MTGWMFGAGTYFSNMFSKSLGYTRYDSSNKYACLSLSEVALGTQHMCTRAEYDIDGKKLEHLGCHSTYGMGKTTVDTKYKFDDRIVVPCGDICGTNIDTTLLYDEFIVYNVEQICQKYVIIVKVL